MKYQRTQVSLDPEDHRKLREEAHQRGISLAALLREIASAHVSEAALEYRTEKSWDALIGIAGEGEPTDIGRFEDQYKQEMWLAKALKVEQEIAEATRESRRKRRAPRKR